MLLTPPTKSSSRAARRNMPPPWRIRDYAWGISDHLWEYEIVERIRQTGAIDASSFSDAIAGEYPIAPAGWEAAEKHAAKANRLHSAYLDDASIAKRAAKRELLRQGMEEVKAAWQAYSEGKGPRPTWENPAAEERRQAQRQADAEAKEAAAIRRQVARAEREARATGRVGSLGEGAAPTRARARGAAGQGEGPSSTACSQPCAAARRTWRDFWPRRGAS